MTSDVVWGRHHESKLNAPPSLRGMAGLHAGGLIGDSEKSCEIHLSRAPREAEQRWKTEVNWK